MGMGPYDSALQMFVQTPRPIDMSRLTFMRWLAEQGRLEHRIAGPVSGPLAELARRRDEVRVGGGGSFESEASALPRVEFMTCRIEGLGPARERGI